MLYVFCVSACFKKDILELIWKKKKGLIGKVQQWETGDLSLHLACYCLVLMRSSGKHG